MKRKYLLLIFVCFSFTTHAQVSPQPADTIIKKLDSLDRRSDSAGFQKNNIQKEAYNETTKLLPRDYFILLGSSIKQEFTKPLHMTRKDWWNFGKFAAIGVTVAVFDEQIQRNALALRNKSPFVRNTGRIISKTGGVNEVFTLAAFGLYGAIVKSEKVKTTTLLATQAVITATLVETLGKLLSGRRRPNFYGEQEEAEPKFTGPFGNFSRGSSGNRTNSSFPSGHTTLAFAAATVFAVEYKNKPLIPIVAYSIASLVAVSRITENKHWASDVFVGAALGYITGRQVAFNYHRLARIKNQQKAKKTLTFNLQYTDWGALQPGLAMKF
ncbi:MAG: phosphatase PAP2 family protein [Ferruginibacter sp.]|nr:phosphatase PAP2 family protein [Ferruginibacter sp.]